MAPPVGRSHYCAGASSLVWRAGRPLFHRDTEASRSEGTGSPGTETEMKCRRRKAKSENVLNVQVKQLATMCIEIKSYRSLLSSHCPFEILPFRVLSFQTSYLMLTHNLALPFTNHNSHEPVGGFLHVWLRYSNESSF